MMEFSYSQDVLEQMERRGITKETVERVLESPGQVLHQADLTVFQSLFVDSDSIKYLVRVFVNLEKRPPVVVTAYKTSKIQKYHEG